MKWLPFDEENRKKVIEFLYAMKDDFDLSTGPGGIEGALQLMIGHGKIFFALKGSEVVGLYGYTYGEPSKHYNNNQIGYIYAAVLNPAFRKRCGGFRSLLHTLILEMQKDGLIQIIFKTEKANISLLKTFSKLASLIGEEVNDGGIPSVIYSTTVNELAAKILPKMKS